jgi:hypothetical protein
MSSAKLAVLCLFLAGILAGCGNSIKPRAGQIPPTATAEGHARLDDPRTRHLSCLRDHKLPVTLVGQTWLQIGSPPSGPRVNFAPTPGAAQYDQISGNVQGAEVIGSALLYPDQASDSLLKTVEDCLAQGVSG